MTAMSNSNITDVSAARMCSNCGACSTICPTDAIGFKFSNIGRLYAVVDDEKCINCGLCRKTCPSLDMQNLHSTYPDPYLGEINDILVGRCADEQLFVNSQSGGACSATVFYLFRTGKIDAAIVCGMDAGNPPVVSARLITGIEGLKVTQKSCYTPVDMLSTLKAAKGYESIAVVGLPCHMQGVEALMRLNRFKNIRYRLGLICDRTLCNTIQDVFCSMSGLSPDYEIVWRHKLLFHNNLCLQYKNAPVTVTSKGKDIRVFPNTFRFLLKDFFTSPRCRVCSDKLNVFADIVFGDPWRMTEVDEERGSSLVITRTASGSELIREMMDAGELALTPRPLGQLIDGQVIEPRKAQIAAYSRAVGVIPDKIDSYLYRQEEARHVSETEEEAARQSIKKFMDTDQLPKSVIIKKARRHIQKELWMQRLHVRGIVRRIKKFIPLK